MAECTCEVPLEKGLSWAVYFAHAAPNMSPAREFLGIDRMCRASRILHPESESPNRIVVMAICKQKPDTVD